MADFQNDGHRATRARETLESLREALSEAKNADSSERRHLALASVVDALITHVERQARAIEDLRSDLTHKQGIVSKIGGGDFREPSSPSKLREFAASSNGDRWFLGRDETRGAAHVMHQANQPSGGAVSHIDIGIFLVQTPSNPEQRELLRLIGTLVP